MKFQIFIISSNRPKNIAMMSYLVGDDVTWLVPTGQKALYGNATSVIEGGGLVESRNLALDLACDSYCVQLSDDLTELKKATRKSGKLEVAKLCFLEAVNDIIATMKMTGAKLGGVASTPNPYFYRSMLNQQAFIVGDFIVVAPTILRFDPQFKLKEDYDFTAAHLAKYGTVARRNDILATFKHRTNAGGACDVRTASLEQDMIARLKIKWPGVFRDNPRRPNEILMRKR